MQFDNTSCSQCGAEFGPGNQGYSHCDDHEGYANHYGYSDVTPYEVVRRVSDKTIEIREMDAVQDESVKLEWVAGGFAGHCINQRDQRWFITSNPENRIIRIRLGKKGWKDKHGRKFGLSDKPVKFYDYNF
jgi:hypothetical protein